MEVAADSSAYAITRTERLAGRSSAGCEAKLCAIAGVISALSLVARTAGGGCCAGTTLAFPVDSLSLAPCTAGGDCRGTTLAFASVDACATPVGPSARTVCCLDALACLCGENMPRCRIFLPFCISTRLGSIGASSGLGFLVSWSRELPAPPLAAPRSLRWRAPSATLHGVRTTSSTDVSKHENLDVPSYLPPARRASPLRGRSAGKARPAASCFAATSFLAATCGAASTCCASCCSSCAASSVCPECLGSKRAMNLSSHLANVAMAL